MTPWPVLMETPAVNRWGGNGPVVHYLRYRHADLYNNNNDHTDRLVIHLLFVEFPAQTDITYSLNII